MYARDIPQEIEGPAQIVQVDETLANEAICFTRYLIGKEASAEVIERYARANACLFQTPPNPMEERMIAFALKHPRAIPLLDTGAGLSRTGARLRQKILVLLAILETMPEHFEATRPDSPGPWRTFATLSKAGAAAGVHAALGLCLCGYLRLATRNERS
jgi:hypothetical protein